MQALPVSTTPWSQITMDFITDLPPSLHRGLVYDSILVVVDRFTKVAKYIPTTKTCTAASLADLFFDEIVSSYGIPNGIVSDRGSVFTSSYWSEFCYALQVKRRLSTAFHPQTDGQTERQNQTLEHYLRVYCCGKQDGWAPLLSIAEFAYNNSVHASLTVSPFFALYGYHPQLRYQSRDETAQGEVPAAADRVKRLQEERVLLANRLRAASEAQTKFYNRSHQSKHYCVGDQVMLSVKNFRVREPSRKLSARFIGPLKILDVIGTQAYRVALPNDYPVHDVFHVSLLEPYRQRDGVSPPEDLPLPELVDNQPEYEVEKVLDSSQSKGQTYYLVKWKGWPSEYNQWIPSSDMGNAERTVATYESQHPHPIPKRRKLRSTQ